MGVIIKAFVTPTKAGFDVWLEWRRPDGVWARLEKKTTDTYGRATWSYSFTSYPQAVRIDLPAGQVVGGVEYGGYRTSRLELEDGQEGHFYLNPEAVEPKIFFIGYVWDYVNEKYIRPKFLIDGKVVQADLGEIFARLDDYPGSYTIEMITEGYDFYSWGVWPDDPYVPSFTDEYANPTHIHAAENCYYYCLVYPTPVGIPTTLTISAPETVAPGQTFNISGILYERDTGVPIPNQPINLSYNGKSLGTATTGIDGDYLKQASIPTEGVYTLKADFLGTASYAASSKTTRTGVGVPLVGIPYIAILEIATGLAIVYLSKR